jgi:8-oxo-dGTP diphosphatase
MLIERKHEPFAHTWALPGGFVDPNETVEEAAARELVEETGVVLPEAPALVGVFSKPGRDPRGWVISVAYALHLPHQQLDPKAGDDAAQVRWFNLDELPPLAFDHADIIRKALQTLEII